MESPKAWQSHQKKKTILNNLNALLWWQQTISSKSFILMNTKYCELNLLNNKPKSDEKKCFLAFRSSLTQKHHQHSSTYCLNKFITLRHCSLIWWWLKKKTFALKLSLSDESNGSRGIVFSRIHRLRDSKELPIVWG